jgi:hypothetical protein
MIDQSALIFVRVLLAAAGGYLMWRSFQAYWRRRSRPGSVRQPVDRLWRAFISARAFGIHHRLTRCQEKSRGVARSRVARRGCVFRLALTQLESRPRPENPRPTACIWLLR